MAGRSKPSLELPTLVVDARMARIPKLADYIRSVSELRLIIDSDDESREMASAVLDVWTTQSRNQYVYPPICIDSDTINTAFFLRMAGFAEHPVHEVDTTCAPNQRIYL